MTALDPHPQNPHSFTEMRPSKITHIDRVTASDTSESTNRDTAQPNRPLPRSKHLGKYHIKDKRKRAIVYYPPTEQ